jgi:hypothetical protein
MTNEILESDIELARELLGKKTPDAEVISSLVRRGIQANRAQELVMALRLGKNPEPDRPFRPAYSQDDDLPTPTSAVPRPPERSRTFSRTETVGTRSRYFFPGLILSLLVLGAGVVYLNSRSHPTSPTEASTGIVEPSGTQTPPGSVRSISFELLEDGVHLSGKKITPRSTLGTLLQLLGPASRTNRLDAINRFVYAYDSLGVLVYSSDGANTESILLDFTAIGGDAGATVPFSGEVKVAGQKIDVDTSASAVAQIKGLNVDQGSPGAAVVSANYNGLHLLFSYFSGPDRLSLVEIDFK